MRGDDKALTALIVAFVLAGLAYYFLSMEEKPADESNGGAKASTLDQILAYPGQTFDTVSSWFVSLFAGASVDTSVDTSEEKTTGGDTPKEDVAPGSADK